MTSISVSAEETIGWLSALIAGGELTDIALMNGGVMYTLTGPDGGVIKCTVGMDEVKRFLGRQSGIV